ncbi:hypothetical protein [Streptomyces sp. NPDC046821]|uniref:hypothetical protein n=1 Tax=Streptomyces sp. NPDC046821 TaxID=3154702 RepID=UPI0033F447B0
MYGNGYMPPPPRPSEAGRIVLRVVFVAMAVLSMGFLAWTALLSLALTTRTRTHWIVFGSVAALQAGTFALLASDPGESEFTTWRGNGGMTIMMLTLAGVVTYYLIADIRHSRRKRAAYYGGGYAKASQVPNPFGQQPPLTGGPVYGYPQGRYAPTPPPTTTPVHAQPTQTAGPAPTPTPIPGPMNQPPQAHRIDQVRAELDELSDYLRKQEGGR